MFNFNYIDLIQFYFIKILFVKKNVIVIVIIGNKYYYEQSSVLC